VLAEGITHKPFGPLNGLDYGNGIHLAKGYENLMYGWIHSAVTGSAETRCHPQLRLRYCGNIPR